MMKTLTEAQVVKLWVRAGQAQDYTLCLDCEKALDGDEAALRRVTLSARNVHEYTVAVSE